MPFEMNIFEPLSTYSSPSRFAVVAIPATSDPVPGSVIARAVIVSPLAHSGSHFFFCSSLPKAWIYGTIMSEWRLAAHPDSYARESSSITIVE